MAKPESASIGGSQVKPYNLLAGILLTCNSLLMFVQVQQFNRNFKPERENKKEKGCWYIGVNFNPPVEETITVTPFMIEAGTGVELKCFKKMENSEPRFISLQSITIQHHTIFSIF